MAFGQCCRFAHMLYKVNDDVIRIEISEGSTKINSIREQLLIRCIRQRDLEMKLTSGVFG